MKRLSLIEVLQHLSTINSKKKRKFQEGILLLSLDKLSNDILTNFDLENIIVTRFTKKT